jgi:Icc-related predicted phosphoesterase
MRHLLVCGGVGGRAKGLDWLRQVVEVRRPDAVLFAGGVLNGVRQYAACGSTAWGLAREDALFIEHFFEVLGGLGTFSAVIPGPGDTPVEDFLRMGMHAELEFPKVHLVHAGLVEQGDTAVCGVGGRLCDGPAGEIDVCSRTLAEYHLRPLWTSTRPHRVLLLACPPAGPLGGDDGSSLVGDLIDSYHPGLCVVGGPNERRGARRMARTLVVNPGHLAQGCAAWVDRSRPVGEMVELLDLHHFGPYAVPADLGVCD